MAGNANAPLGLTAEEAGRRLAETGPNALPEAPRAGLARRFLRQFQSALIYLLLLALGFDLAAWIYEGMGRTPVEALAILAVLLLNAVLGVLQEYRSEHAIDELEAMSSPRAWVYRDGVLEQIERAVLVPGDVVRLEAGDRVPADGTALDPESLRVDESLMTGESLPVDKTRDDELFSGTLVAHGRTSLAVTRTGPNSATGKLAGTLARIESGKTPLELRIDELGGRVAKFVAALSAILVAGGLAVEGLSQFPEIVMFAVAFAVAVVPEGMPAVMTLVLSLGVQRMARKNAVVRRLAAVEGLGSVTVIASDKTGTLTTNSMTADALHGDREGEALLALALANDADMGSEAGDPLERALVAFAQVRGADVNALRAAHPRVSSRPFDSRWKYMRVSVISPGGEHRSYLKGAVEVILDRSALDPETRAAWRSRAELEAERGYKVLGLASGRGDSETDLEFLGFVTLWDPPRPEAARAVKAAEEAGIRVIMITGDHPRTALAIGECVGIVSPKAMVGEELDGMSPTELADALRTVRIFSRMLPEHKLRIVETLAAQGEIVAMTGDGLNDAPALKRADIGVAMGLRGSDVAREVADLVLRDDHFATIVTAVEEGRVIYENLQKFIRFTFSSNVALMVLVLGGALGSALLDLRTPEGALLLPLTALQILWINFLGDGPPALALAADRSPGIMVRPPRPPRSPLLDPTAVRFIVMDGVFKGLVGLALLVIMPELGMSIATTATSVFCYEAVAKLLSAYPARTIGSSPKTNPWLHVSVGVGVLLTFTWVLVPPLRTALGLTAIDGRAVLVVGMALLLTWLSGAAIAHTLRAPQKQELRPRTA